MAAAEYFVVAAVAVVAAGRAVAQLDSDPALARFRAGLGWLAPEIDSLGLGTSAELASMERWAFALGMADQELGKLAACDSVRLGCSEVAAVDSVGRLEALVAVEELVEASMERCCSSVGVRAWESSVRLVAACVEAERWNILLN